MENCPQWLRKAKGPVLLLGETGTGKSTFAKSLHDKWDSSSPFIVVHLATLNENIIESELFGCTKGSFTGALKDKIGYVEAVKHGTLFLDEVGELSLSSQKKLLYLLEEKKFSPLGSYEKRVFKGKIIAATNKNLKRMVSEKTFREDLYYRLTIFCHEIEPVRVNQLKKIDLIRSYFEKFKKDYEKEKLILSGDCLSYLTLYDWPGNIREIKNCMEFLVSSSETLVATLKNLPNWLYLSEKIKNMPMGPELNEMDYFSAKESFEKSFFYNALVSNRGMINKTAKNIGISKTTLIAKVRKYGINISSRNCGDA
jgi:transcriptional regulator with PAS, ATPase and Fis domain